MGTKTETLAGRFVDTGSAVPVYRITPEIRAGLPGLPTYFAGDEKLTPADGNDPAMFITVHSRRLVRVTL